MPYYMQIGDVPKKRHTQFRRPDGKLYTEEVIGAEGFSGIQSIAYHIHQPTIVDRIDEPVDYDIEYADEDFLRHRHIKGFEVEAGGDWLSGRTYMMGNSDVNLALVRPTEQMDGYSSGMPPATSSFSSMKGKAGSKARLAPSSSPTGTTSTCPAPSPTGGCSTGISKTTRPGFS